MSSRSERAQNLVNFVKDEIERFRSGEIDGISTIGELENKFGYTHNAPVYRLLKRRELLRERETIKLESWERRLVPSSDLAWMLGVLVAGATMDSITGTVRLNRTDDDLKSAFASVGERLFGINVRENVRSHSKKNNRSTEAKEVLKFTNTRMVRALGNLSRGRWPDTIVERYRWILDDPRYTWSFLGGIFDTRGWIGVEKGTKLIITSSYHSNVINFTSDLLSRVGIKNARPNRIGGERRRVTIDNLKDIKTFADNFHSKIPEKEKVLEYYRQQSLEKIPIKVSSENEAIAEWKRLYQLLSHVPTASEIDYLRWKRETKWSSSVYTNRFGVENGKKKSYLAVIRYLVENHLPEAKKELDTRLRRMPEYKIVKDVNTLLYEYRRAREISLREKGRLPLIYDLKILREVGVVSYSAQTFANYFGDGKFTKARENLEKIVSVLPPSRELAWVLGVLSVGGYVSRDGKIILTRALEEELRDAFMATGEKIFKRKAREGVDKRNGKEYKRVEFSKIRATRLIGDLRRSEWPKTILEKHMWILDYQKYIWDFIEGMFDTKGQADLDRKEIRFPTTSMSEVKFIVELLKRVGIKNPRIIPSDTNKAKEKTRGVAIRYVYDVKNFADNIHSKILEREKRLDFFRRESIGRVRAVRPSIGEAIEEWIQIKNSLGHNPSSYDIDKLKQEKRTKFNSSVYAIRFGKTSENKSGRSFRLAQENLERIINEREEAKKSQNESSNGQETQIFP